MNTENRHNIPEEFLRPYSPTESEPLVYQTWETSGFFNPDVCIEKGVTKSDAEHFSIVLPPPNVTGTLHTGHALMLVIQDIMVRYQRMLGKKTLWIPGTDHAAIATQSKVEKLLEKEGLKKHDLGREAFLKRVEQFAQESHDTIVHQTKKMGASLDWSREAYTLDDKRNLAVRTAFKKMYDDGLIYRKYRVVNWDPKGQTVISDDEIVYEERDAVLYTFKYWNDFPISISTTRPETKIGDAAVAVHPDDVRYQQYIGQTFTGTFCGVDLSIKIIADRSVEQEFGTGALGVTPAHSKIDWDIAQ
jgi:valyl-tRNA synthetase